MYVPFVILYQLIVALEIINQWYHWIADSLGSLSTLSLYLQFQKKISQFKIQNLPSQRYIRHPIFLYFLLSGISTRATKDQLSSRIFHIKYYPSEKIPRLERIGSFGFAFEAINIANHSNNRNYCSQYQHQPGQELLPKA